MNAFRINNLVSQVDRQVIKYSETGAKDISSYEILVVDTIGILAYLYKYATVAYIGGGFGNGIHNIQEPVTFGVPVIFGPNYHKFSEARDLVSLGGAFSITTSEELLSKVGEITSNPQEHLRLSAICRNYVEKSRGATEKIMEFLELVSW